MTDLKDFERIREFYDTDYYAEGKGGPLKSQPWHTRRVAKRLGDLREKHVLDIACGRGEWLELLKAGGAKISGIDLSERAVASCKARMPDGDFHQGPAENLPFADDSFDVVSCLGSLEHFLDKPRALAEMRRVAKRSAHFLILVPNAGFPTRRLLLYKGTNQARIKEDVYGLDQWARLFADAGLKITRRWKDLHVVSPEWIRQGRAITWPVRALQSGLLMVWPIGWQYQVYHLCENE